MSAAEVFLDETPGETRGIVMRGGRPERLLIQRDDDAPAARLGARSVGRVARVEPGLRGAFVELGEGPPGFLPLTGGQKAADGQKVEVEVSAEPRGGKGPALRLIGPGQGEPRLLAAGPSVRDALARLAPGAEPVGGAAAILAGREAEDAALAPGEAFEDLGLDVWVERTRAMVAVDLDLTPGGGGRGPAGRDRANRQGLFAAARMIRLKGWGGLVSVDLVGVGHDGRRILDWAREAFGTGPEIAFGPVSRFGVLQLSLPWRRTPIEEHLLNADGRRSPRTRVQDAVRGLALALMQDTGAARLTLACAPEEAAGAAGRVSALGPRAAVRADPACAPGGWRVEAG